MLSSVFTVDQEAWDIRLETDYLRDMLAESMKRNITFPDRELAFAPIRSEIGEHYLGAIRGGINCALANRQIITHFTREAFIEMFPQSHLRLIYDISHNTCKNEWHEIHGERKKLFVHRKGGHKGIWSWSSGITKQI